MENAPKIISRINIDAVIVETKDHTHEEKNHYNLIRVKLKLPDDKTCTVRLNKKYQPIVGKTVPLILKIYDNGTSKCHINYDLLPFLAKITLGLVSEGL